MFDHLDQEPWHWTAADHVLADTISSYWVNFVTFGDPNGRGLPRWPAYTIGGDAVLYLQSEITLATVADLPGLKSIDATYSRLRGSSSTSR